MRMVAGADAVRARLERGLVPAVPVPFRGRTLDAEALSAYTRWMAAQPVAGVAVNVHTGRGRHLAEPARRQVLEARRRKAGGATSAAVTKAPPTAAPARGPASRPPRPREASLIEKTGHGLDHWFAVLDAFDAVLVPWGGGGLTTGVASALQALRPQTKIYVCEPATGAPVAAAIANGRVPKSIDFAPSFVDGAGSGSLLPKMWAHAEPLVTDAFPISLEDTAAGVRLLLERGRIVGEGAAGRAITRSRYFLRPVP